MVQWLSMDWLWWIIIPVGLWYFIRQWQKNTSEAKIEKYEELEYKYYNEAVERVKKEIEERKEAVHGKELVLVSKDELKEMLKRAEEEYKHTLEVNDKFTRIKERMRHRPAKEKLEFHHDWVSYLLALRRIETQGKILDVSDGETVYDDYHSAVKEIKIEMEEIEKRFDDRLKS